MQVVGNGVTGTNQYKIQKKNYSNQILYTTKKFLYLIACVRYFLSKFYFFTKW